MTDMNGKDKIIARILEDAAAKCDAVVSNARQNGEQLCEKAQNEVRQARESAEEKCVADKQEILKRKLAVADLDIKKYVLSLKQQTVSEVFDKAFEKVMNLKDEQYLSLIKRLLSAYAEKGEKLVLCEKGRKVVTSGVASQYGVALSEKVADFKGGFILEGNGYDKDVTLKTLLEQLRFQYESQVSAILFGD